MSNLLPPQQQRSITRLYRKRFLTIVFFLVAGLLLVGSIFFVQSLNLSHNNEDILTKKHTTLTGRETSTLARSLATSVALINQKLRTFSDSMPESPVTKDVLAPVLSVRGEFVKLNNFDFKLDETSLSKATIRISGVAENRETLLAFTDRVKKLNGFTEVDLPIMSFIKNANVTFTITATVALK